jgi:hypothetical protein
MRHLMITTVVARTVADRIVDCATFAAVVIAHALNRQPSYQHLGQRMSWLLMPEMPSLLLHSERSTRSIKPRSGFANTSNTVGNFRMSSGTRGGC